MSSDHKIIMQLETLAGQMYCPDAQRNHHTRQEGEHRHPDGQLNAVRTDSHDVQWDIRCQEIESNSDCSRERNNETSMVAISFPPA
jgi:hypothetical protein